MSVSGQPQLKGEKKECKQICRMCQSRRFSVVKEFHGKSGPGNSGQGYASNKETVEQLATYYKQTI
jgi:hypothetical protein